MYGAILGDIIGSPYEFNQRWNGEPILTNKSFFTDDTILYLATKYAIQHNIPYEIAYKKFARKYKKASWGSMFRKWYESKEMIVNNSYGNGSAMKVGFIGEYYNDKESVEREAVKTTLYTHNHKDGMQGAVVTALLTFYAKNGKTKDELKEIFEYYYKENFNNTPMEDLRKLNIMNLTCQISLPLAFKCFYESENYEDCMKNVLKIDCDTDTICCISGSIAENFYGTTGFDNEMDLLEWYLDDFLLSILKE